MAHNVISMWNWNIFLCGQKLMHCLAIGSEKKLYSRTWNSIHEYSWEKSQLHIQYSEHILFQPPCSTAVSRQWNHNSYNVLRDLPNILVLKQNKQQIHIILLLPKIYEGSVKPTQWYINYKRTENVLHVVYSNDKLNKY